jgi:truncated hemoglobin YjbI
MVQPRDDSPNSPPHPSLYDLAGGLDGIERVLADFYAHVFVDAMIGFMFSGADPQRLVRTEAELTARLLGASQISYTGRPIGAVHRPHRIFGGQFERRMMLLSEAMARNGVPDAVRTAWLGHNRSLRRQVTVDAGAECDGPEAASVPRTNGLAVEGWSPGEAG